MKPFVGAVHGRDGLFSPDNTRQEYDRPEPAGPGLSLPRRAVSYAFFLGA